MDLRNHPILCRLIDHRDDGRESGYGVCGRCGLHDYHDFEEKYGPGMAMITGSIRLLQLPFRRLAEACRRLQCRLRFASDYRDDIPF